MALFRHVLFPVGATSLLVFAYMSPRLRDVVAPKDRGREFGLLEGLQVLLLLACLATLVVAAIRTRVGLRRALLAAFAAGVLFLLLEETDCGMVYLGRGWNVHHDWGLTRTLKVASDIAVFVLFFLVPLAIRRPRTRWMRFLRPSRWYIASVAAMVVVSKAAHQFVDRLEPPHALHGNVSEFRELFYYYILLIYAWDLGPRMARVEDHARTDPLVPAAPVRARRTVRHSGGDGA